MGIIIAFICFFLDGLLSIYQVPSLFNVVAFKAMFTIVALVLIFPFFIKYPKDYYKICVILGLLYDIIYTNTLVLNTLIFLLLAYIIHRLYEMVSNTLINTVIINIIILALYHVITYIILVLIGYLPLDIILFSNNFLGLIITNTIFFIIIYSFITFLSNKKNKRFLRL